jgi:ribosomal protein L11 methyltransferase
LDSPAIDVRFPVGTPAGARERLLARLTDFDLIAVHEDDPIAPASWTVHFGTAASRDAALSAVRAAADIDGLVLQPVDVPDDDWARRTQADLPAVQVGGVIVAPPWDVPLVSAERDRRSAATIVEIEPSRGFGTGHHQSTRLCLVLLQNRDLEGRTVVDVGTGSGVLAITAAKLGAAFVSAIDVDAEAVENARENVERNGVGAIVEAHVRDIEESSLSSADVVTANLTGTLLAKHARRLVRLVKPGGALIAAGFTADERHIVEEAFASELAIAESAEEDGWWAFALIRA